MREEVRARLWKTSWGEIVPLRGGVSANKQLREALKNTCESWDKKFFTTNQFIYSTDNAAMIASVAYFLYEKNPEIAKIQFVDANPRLVIWPPLVILALAVAVARYPESGESHVLDFDRGLESIQIKHFTPVIPTKCNLLFTEESLNLSIHYLNHSIEDLLNEWEILSYFFAIVWFVFLFPKLHILLVLLRNKQASYIHIFVKSPLFFPIYVPRFFVTPV